MNHVNAANLRLNPVNSASRRVRAALTSLVAAALAVVSLHARGAELILTHGHIYTSNTEHPWVEALAVTDGRISAVGSEEQVSQQKTDHSQVVDLQGQTVLPGFIDSHMHMMQGSMALHGVNLSTPALSITPIILTS